LTIFPGICQFIAGMKKPLDPDSTNNPVAGSRMREENKKSTYQAVMKHPVHLCYLKHQQAEDLVHIEKPQLEQWLAELPPEKQAAVKRLARRSDRLTSLLATRLLKLCARDVGIENFYLTDVHYPEKAKPCWLNETASFFDFNITHTDSLIVVAASNSVTLGIDAEKIRKLKNLNFRRVLSPFELSAIQATPVLFFDFWTIREAVVKAANTRGLVRMHDVYLEQNRAILDDKEWYIKSIELDRALHDQFVVHLATSEPDVEISIKRVMLNDLLPAQS
jgi:4'-phosphopantetheinyl transferase